MILVLVNVFPVVCCISSKTYSLCCIFIHYLYIINDSDSEVFTKQTLFLCPRALWTIYIPWHYLNAVKKSTIGRPLNKWPSYKYWSLIPAPPFHFSCKWSSKLVMFFFLFPFVLLYGDRILIHSPMNNYLNTAVERHKYSRVGNIHLFL